jgi:hypothetical protein
MCRVECIPNAAVLWAHLEQVQLHGAKLCRQLRDPIAFDVELAQLLEIGQFGGERAHVIVVQVQLLEGGEGPHVGPQRGESIVARVQTLQATPLGEARGGDGRDPVVGDVQRTELLQEPELDRQNRCRVARLRGKVRSAKIVFRLIEEEKLNKWFVVEGVRRRTDADGCAHALLPKQHGAMQTSRRCRGDVCRGRFREPQTISVNI